LSALETDIATMVLASASPVSLEFFAHFLLALHPALEMDSASLLAQE